MEQSRPRRRTTPWIWGIGTLAALVGWVLLAVHIVRAFWEGELMTGRGDASHPVTATTQPTEFALQIAVRLLLLAGLSGFIARQIGAWRNRRQDASDYEAQLDRIDRSSSKLGNAIAWAALVPVVLVSLFLLLALVRGCTAT